METNKKQFKGLDPFYNIEYHEYGGEYGNININYLSFKTALAKGLYMLDNPHFMNGLNYAGVMPHRGGNEFAILYVTPDYLKNINPSMFGSQGDYTVFKNAAQKFVNTNKIQIGKYGLNENTQKLKRILRPIIESIIREIRDKK